MNNDFFLSSSQDNLSIIGCFKKAWNIVHGSYGPLLWCYCDLFESLRVSVPINCLYSQNIMENTGHSSRVLPCLQPVIEGQASASQAATVHRTSSLEYECRDGDGNNLFY